LVLTGEPIDAERAYHFGMVNRLVEPGRAIDEAITLAEKIVENAPLAVRGSRRVLRESLGDEASGFRMSAEALAELYKTEDFAEGPRAFIEKRAPVWKGR
jgi:enoyl-CoA hydratase/carnithine racemase